MSTESTDIDLDEIAESLSKDAPATNRWRLAIVGAALMTIATILPWYALASRTNSNSTSVDPTGYTALIHVMGYDIPLGWVASLIAIGALGLTIACFQQKRQGGSVEAWIGPTIIAGYLAAALSIYAFVILPLGQGNMGMNNADTNADISSQLGVVLYTTGAALYICALRGFPSWLRDLITAWGPAILIVLTIRNTLAEPFKIPSGSMVPTLEVGDHILVSKMSYGLKIPFTNVQLFKFGEPQIGDVIVFRYPVEPGKDYIKRIVAGPGDLVELKENELFVKSRKSTDWKRYDQADAGIHGFLDQHCGYDPTTEERSPVELEKKTETTGTTKHSILIGNKNGRNSAIDFSVNRRKIEVPSGHYFVMGDNRHHSQDSRWWGFVPRENIKGKAKWIWFSYNKCEGSIPIFGSLRTGRIGKSIP